ncbi:unnamed protein product [Polarella glacialis]|uniref:SAM domain-containing protein n=1 Tax=Polarella glacialis TaxID=89957 RepID=A0A813DFS1_POLGL|nr:unnamed protein product [Polarella glacialis]
MARSLLYLVALLPLCFSQDACPARGSMASWKADQVGEWLRSLGIDKETAAKFVEQDVDGPALLELSDEEMKTELGVSKLGQRKKILQNLASCAGPAVSTSKQQGAPQKPAAKQQLGPSEVLPGVSQQLLELAAFGKMNALSMHFLGKTLNQFQVAMVLELHEAGQTTDWPQVADLASEFVSKDFRKRLHSLSLPVALGLRAEIVQGLMTHLKWNDVEVMETISLRDSSFAMYASPDSSIWPELEQLHQKLEAWLSKFPEDIYGHFWANRLAFFRADWKRANSSNAQLYDLTHAYAKQVCLKRPPVPIYFDLGVPHGKKTIQLELISEDCRKAGDFLKDLAGEWARQVFLSARDGAGEVSSSQAALEAFMLRTKGYTDKDALQEFLVGPGDVFGQPFIMSPAGLRHHRDQMEELAMVMEGTPACGAEEGADAADLATTATLQSRFSGSCPKVAQKLRSIAEAYGRAVARMKESNKPGNFDPAVNDALVVPGDAVRDILPYFGRDLHIDPSGRAFEPGKLVLSAPSSSEKWHNSESIGCS